MSGFCMENRCSSAQRMNHSVRGKGMAMQDYVHCVCILIAQQTVRLYDFKFNCLQAAG